MTVEVGFRATRPAGGDRPAVRNWSSAHGDDGVRACRRRR